MENAVTLNNVKKSFKDFQLDNISFSVKKGFITGFIGPNGSGKTTTIKLMMNLISQDSGSLTMFGRDHAEHAKHLKQRIGFVYAENHFYEHLTVRQMKRVIASFYREWDEELFVKYMDYFALPWKKKIKHLSTGMKMKFSLACALSHHPDLIIMDEPTSGLDPVFRRELLTILTEVIQDENKTIFFSTHITSDLEQIADYITFIHNGKIILNDTKEALNDQYHIVRGANERMDEDARHMFIYARETSVGFEGLTNQPEKIRRKMGQHTVLEPASLEDIMVYTTRSERYA
ncbi:phenol-soluble modulin export ABC transporter ATP-binding protein PmtA [Salibacterium halotolerans]|uniref:ABC-2 type transport system ATP-binding protein n=1 Tax=Salibacterium halotolerans TaxID=1884432 RepID=A0A1I5TAM9_9BACI|nr:ABC transporter ATP-binding protein [Salibacterium halotolerans]SFP79891.1 ABC-2 type transport system ATP-binding protein [Salibacterium halotolerans]